MRGPFSFVADARIDNRPELAQRLSIPAADLRTMSDAAVVFEALLRWGDDAPNKLVGEFAFALWNEQARVLLLGRDILGDRPLYVHRNKDFIAFASMPSGLHALPEIPKAANAEFVAEQIALLPQNGTASYFQHIDRVQPAHLLRIEADRCSSRRYWQPSRPNSTPRSAAQYEEELRSVFDDAVRSQLRGAGSAVATHLSGGLDSGTVTATAASQLRDGRIAAFTAVPRRGFDGPVPPGRIGDESELAAALASQYPNIDHVLIESGGSPLEGLDREHLYQQQPIGNICNAIWSRRICKAASERGLKVLLTGDAGNMTISYAGLERLSDLFKRGHVIAAMRLAAALVRNGVPLHSVGAQMIGPVLPTRVWSTILKISGRSDYISNVTGLSQHSLTQVLEKARQRAVDLAFRPSTDGFDLRVDVLTGSDGANWVKGVLAEWGLSLRSPTLDKRVIEYCLSVPVGEFIRKGIPRSLARRAFADRLPREVLTATGRGYQGADWYEGILGNMPAMQAEVAAIARNRGGAILDVDWLQDTVDTFPDRGWATNDVPQRYRAGFLRAISAGHFMRKVAGTN